MSQEVFGSLDDHPWRLTYKWAKYSRPNKPKSWIITRYYGRFNPARHYRWVFGHRDSGTYLPKFAWTKVVRHYMVPGTACPDDPALDPYWADRRRRTKPPLGNATLRLLQTQHSRCPLRRGYLLHADREPDSPGEWEQWRPSTRKAIARQNLTAHGRMSALNDIRLVHVSCERRTRKTGASGDPVIPTPERPSGLA